MFRNLALSLIFGIFTIVGQAQAVHPKGLDTVQWDVDGSWYFIPFAPDRPAFTFRNDLLKSISRPAGDGNGWCFRDGEAWFISISSEQGTEEKLNFWHSDLAKGTWEILGDIETKHGFPVLLYKLSGDDFLGINWLEGFQSEKSASFAARFRLKEKGLVFQSLVSVPFGELASVLKSASAPMALDPGGSSLPATFEWQHPSLIPSLWGPLSTPHNIFVIASRLGVIWIFDGDTGAFKKFINLSNLSVKDMDKASYLDHFILAAQPLPDGSLVVATRELQVFKLAVELYVPPEPKEAHDRAKALFMQLVRDLRSIRWMILDHETLTIHETINPTYPSVLGPNYRGTGRFQFLLTPDNRVHTGFDPDWTNLVRDIKTQKPIVKDKEPVETKAIDLDPATKQKIEPPH